MSANGWLQLAFFMALLLLLAKPLGTYMALVYEGRRIWLDRLLSPLERLTYRICGVNPQSEMRWTSYAAATLSLGFVSLLAVYALERLQAWLPFNPQQLPNVSADLSFNTAVSFATNTNWQAYGGEVTMSYLTQMLALAVQNFVSAATGMAVLAALVRGLTFGLISFDPSITSCCRLPSSSPWPSCRRVWCKTSNSTRRFRFCNLSPTTRQRSARTGGP